MQFCECVFFPAFFVFVRFISAILGVLVLFVCVGLSACVLVCVVLM